MSYENSINVRLQMCQFYLEPNRAIVEETYHNTLKGFMTYNHYSHTHRGTCAHTHTHTHTHTRTHAQTHTRIHNQMSLFVYMDNSYQM